VNRILQDGDVLVMGAPGALRWGTSFAGSHPDRIAKRMSQPLILLSSAPSGAASLRRLFWGDLILPQAQASGREEAVELLIDCLIRHNQLSPSDKDRIFRAALERENISSTAVDCDTAFPHVLLPGFFGVSACMGIFPEGVKFGAGDGSLSHFIFLMITPKGFSEEYLKVLAKIAKRMICADVRFALLNCRTSQEVLQVLEPDIKQH
jgi:mannitol/fructose-specific phosphotransferase system IIA component (Ntr-type)